MEPTVVSSGSRLLFNHLRANQKFSKRKMCRYTSLMCSTTSTLYAFQQPKSYICLLLLFCISAKYFDGSKQGCTYTSFTYFPRSQRIYIRLHKVTFERYLVVGCNFLDIIEIMSNCKTNTQGHIYTSILQGFSKSLVS